ncbi:unnamed protein product [Calypogeia fissa]
MNRVRGTGARSLWSFLKVETSFKRISGLNSHVSAQEQLINRRQFSVESKHKDSGQELSEFSFCGGQDRVVITKENLQINPRVWWRQDLREVGNVTNHGVSANQQEAAIQTKYLRLKNKQRTGKLPVRPGKNNSISGKSGSGRKSYCEGSQNSRQASTVYALNRQISILMETGYREEAYAIYKKIVPAGCKPDSYTYLHLIKGFCECGELKEAQELFRRIFAGEGFSCSGSEVFLYNAMVHGLGSAGLAKEALNLVDEMTRRGFTPDIYTYNSLLHSLGKVGKVTEALTVFESMAGNGFTPDVVTYNSVINCLGKAGRAMEAYEIYERMTKEGCLPDLHTFNTLLPVLGKAGELDLARNLYKYMTTVGCEPDVYTYTSLVTSLCRANRVDEALRVSVEMTEKGCAPNTVTFNIWLDGLCKGGRVVEAHLLFRRMLALGYAPDKITYCILIDASCKTGQFVDKSFDLLKDLLQCTCHLDRRTSDIVYQSFKKVGMLKQAKRIARNARAKQSCCSGSDLKVVQSLQPVLAS